MWYHSKVWRSWYIYLEEDVEVRPCTTNVGSSLKSICEKSSEADMRSLLHAWEGLLGWRNKFLLDLVLKIIYKYINCNVDQCLQFAWKFFVGEIADEAQELW
jgi:hypothetical protein